MTTTGERLVTLSELLTVETAMVHYLAITTGGGAGGVVLVGELDVTLEDEITAAVDDTGLTGVVSDPVEITVDEEIEVDIEDDGLTGEIC
jgi:hypothetical protein